MSTTATESVLSPAAADAPRWVLLAQEAVVRGFRNALAFRRWCRKRHITIVTEGKFQWVSPADVDRALDAISSQGIPSEPAPPSDDTAVASAVSTLMLQRRKS